MRGGVRGCSSTFLFTFGLHDVYIGWKEVEFGAADRGRQGRKEGAKRGRDEGGTRWETVRMTGSDGLHGAGFGAGDAHLPMADGAAVADHDISGGAIRCVRTMDCRLFFINTHP